MNKKYICKNVIKYLKYVSLFCTFVINYFKLVEKLINEMVKIN